MRTLLFALGTAALVGCHTTKSDGPLSKDSSKTSSAAKVDTTPPPPLKPTPPTMLVTPNDVSAASARDAASKLTSELGMDSKASTNGPVTVEVSRVKGGIK